MFTVSCCFHFKCCHATHLSVPLLSCSSSTSSPPLLQFVYQFRLSLAVRLQVPLISCSSPISSVYLLQFLCQFCYKLFKTKHGYLFHLRAAHSVGETPRCPHCGKDDIKSRATYYLHVKKCKAKDNAPWQDNGHCGVICSQTTNEYAHFGAISMYVDSARI